MWCRCGVDALSRVACQRTSLVPQPQLAESRQPTNDANGMDRPRSRPQRFSECAGACQQKEHHHARTTTLHAVTAIGIDMGKTTLHMIGLDARGAIVLRERVSRGRIASRLANVPPCLIGIEAGMATHYVSSISRTLKKLRCLCVPGNGRERNRSVVPALHCALFHPLSSSGRHVGRAHHRFFHDR